jgi:predicted helicase
MSKDDYVLYIKRIISNRYSNCWLLKEVPDNILINLKLTDLCCDIVCQNYDLSYIFIQCINHLVTNIINISDLSNFYNFIAETGYNGVIYYSGKLSLQILCRKQNIKYINMHYMLSKL